MSRELFKSMVYRNGKVFTRQSSNNDFPKDYHSRENVNLTNLYQEMGHRSFEKFFINLILEGAVEVLSGSNNTLRKLNYIANLLWEDRTFTELRNKEDEILTKSFRAKTEEEKNNAHIEYKNIREDIANYISSFYDNHTRLNKNIERSR